MKLKKYVTTTLPYVNERPHIGFAMEIIRADAYARYYELLGYEVFFNTGTDEHGLKIWQNAESSQCSIEEYVNKYAEKFRSLKSLLGLSESIHFIRTTDNQHIKAAQEFWKRCEKNDFIYKKKYQGKYCIGCELEKTDSELEKGKCIFHPQQEIQLIDEENYFFKFSKCQEALINLYNENPNFVIPSFRFNEIKQFVQGGLKDFSISRLKTKMPWGIPVPGDEDHVMYVWFDALVNYISPLGWPHDMNTFESFWLKGNPVQYAGKDNLRPQAAMWQAMLYSLGLPPTHQIVINGFITSGGKKMSKSLGNVLHPEDLVKQYGADALRYYVLRHVHPFEDSDVTQEKFDEAYHAHLVNGLGNLVQRIMSMLVRYEVDISHINFDPHITIPSFHRTYLDTFKFHKVMDDIWSLIGDLDQFIAEHEPFKKIKINKKEAHRDLSYLSQELARIALSLYPFLPETAKKIQKYLTECFVPDVPLFERKN